MKAIETLMDEHRQIERVLGSLETFAERAHLGEGAPADLAGYVAFLRGFADELHHAKEERILFVRMVANGFPEESGPIAMMLHEHTVGRTLVGVLAALAEKKTPWSDADRAELYAAATDFSGLLRTHIQKEDRILYPMSEQHVSPEEFEAMAQEFERHGAAQAARTARLLAVAEGLRTVYPSALEPEREDAPGPHGCELCGGH